MAHVSRRAFIGLSIVSGLAGVHASAAFAANAAATIDVYKSPSCGCCGAWVDHIRKEGFKAHVTETEDLEPVKAKAGVPADLQSCHTAFVENYVIEGHVPAREIQRLLKERPAAAGLAVPGMPSGSPGMEQGARKDSYQVILFSPSRRSVLAQY